jgi:hypothetical protein
MAYSRSAVPLGLVRVVRGGLANIFQVVSMADDENVVGLNGFAVGASLSRLRYLTQARMNILWHGKKAGGCRITYLHIESFAIPAAGRFAM